MVMTEERTLSGLAEAFEHAHTVGNRRQAPRIREEFAAEISRWDGNRAGPAFAAVVVNISTQGVGIQFDERLETGAQYRMDIARPGRAPLSRVITIIHTDAAAGGSFATDVEPDEILDLVNDALMRRAPASRSRSRGMKTGFVVLAFVASAAAMLLMSM